MVRVLAATMLPHCCSDGQHKLTDAAALLAAAAAILATAGLDVSTGEYVVFLDARFEVRALPSFAARMIYSLRVFSSSECCIRRSVLFSAFGVAKFIFII